MALCADTALAGGSNFSCFPAGAVFVFISWNGYGMILTMNKSRLIYSILAIVFGAFMVVYGEMDDSPGAQLLGLLAVVLGIVGVLKSRQK
jgi:hypothetical protein